MNDEKTHEAVQGSAWLPPRWFIRLFWAGHRAIHTATRGRLGLTRPTASKWGMMRLHTIGRTSGVPRSAILGYFQDGANLVTMAMNGWGQPEPAWWLNLQAQPETTVETVDGPIPVRGRAATGDERARLWAKWAEYDEKLDAWASRRPTETAVVILEPLPAKSARLGEA